MTLVLEVQIWHRSPCVILFKTPLDGWLTRALNIMKSYDQARAAMPCWHF
jgi:hypothetical protein